MAEGFITRRGGVSSEQALAPTITFVSKTDTQIVFTIKNNDTSTAVILWELDDATPDANSFELAADTTSSNITVTGLTGSTEFIVYATANVTGKVKSNVSQLSITTDAPIVYTAATGGTTLEYNDGGKRYRSHTFTSSGNFVVTTVGDAIDDRNKVDYLIIAGGAGGGMADGSNGGAGGGGAGGYRTTLGTSGANSSAESKVTVTNQSYGITIGSGGNAVSTNNTRGNNGSNSSALGITSIGGGAGSGRTVSALAGGSGGGHGADNFAGGSGTANQGFAGGNRISCCNSGGGGGGASQVGGGGSNMVCGAGGNGLSNTLRTGSAETRAGGGGSGGFCSGGSGGTGGGGRGEATSTASVTSGTANTGGGGGGGCTTSFGVGSSGAGGSGIVIIRYEIAPSA